MNDMPEIRGLHSVAHQFVPERLTLAREWKGLTKAELADRLEKTPSTVTQLESGRIKPDPQTVGRLALALGVPVLFFSKKLSNNLLSIEEAHFRSLRSATQSSRKRLLSLGTIACELLNFCEEYITFPSEQVSLFSKNFRNPNQIDDLASEVRRTWGLNQGPISDLITLLESKGIVVIVIPEEYADIGAFSAWYGKRPFIFLIDKKSSTRLRFDASHELGHLIMHADIKPGHQICEREADRFASAFLLPKESFIKECPSRLDLNYFYELKQRWKTSVAAMLRRGYDLGKISDASYKRGFVQLSMRNEREVELYEPPKEHPSIIDQAIELISQKFTLKEVLDNQGISISDLEKVLLFKNPGQSELFD